MRLRLTTIAMMALAMQNHSTSAAPGQKYLIQRTPVFYKNDRQSWQGQGKRKKKVVKQK